MYLDRKCAHAILPLQRQGTSHSVEGVEALRAIFQGVEGNISGDEVEEKLKEVFKYRYKHASTVQLQSRLHARLVTESGAGEMKVTMNPVEFMKFNARYRGARE
jgi:hypothetical protein